MKKIVISFITLAILGCNINGGKSDDIYNHHKQLRGIYFWKNKFNLSEEDEMFIEQHGIKRMYIRYFDVVTEDLNNGRGIQVVPSATIEGINIVNTWFFERNNIEIVPTVFITLEALKKIQENHNGQFVFSEDDIAFKLMKRIKPHEFFTD